MGILDDFAADLAAEVEELGGSTTATFTPYGSAAVPNLPVIFRKLSVEVEVEVDGRQELSDAVLHAAPALVPTVTTRDTWTVGGTVYAVLAIPRREGLVEFVLQARSTQRKGGGNSYRQRK